MTHHNAEAERALRQSEDAHNTEAQQALLAAAGVHATLYLAQVTRDGDDTEMLRRAEAAEQELAWASAEIAVIRDEQDLPVSPAPDVAADIRMLAQQLGEYDEDAETETLRNRAETAEKERDNYYDLLNRKCRQNVELDQLLKRVADLSARWPGSLVSQIHEVAVSYRTDEDDAAPAPDDAAVEGLRRCVSNVAAALGCDSDDLEDIAESVRMLVAEADAADDAPDDAAVERAAEAMWRSDGTIGRRIFGRWDESSESVKYPYRVLARAALEAARQGGENRG